MDVASLWRQFLCYAFAVIESSSGRPALPIRVLYLQLLRAHTAVALDADFKRLSWKRMTHPSAVHCYQPPRHPAAPLPNLRSIMLLETFD